MSRAQRHLAAAYRVETGWRPEHARVVLEDRGWDLDAATDALDALRTQTHRHLEQTAITLRARRVGTDQERAAALAAAHVRADAEIARRQALLVDVHRAHRSTDA